MSYLYLNFLDNLCQGSKSWDDFYTLSLTEQYDALKRKIGRNAPDTLQELIAACCPMNNLTYYVSMPSFDRKITTDRRGRECIYNIVIRPEKSAYSINFIPSKYDLIFIGDVAFGRVTDVTVKGIELIDSGTAKFGEKSISCIGVFAFSTKTFLDRMGRPITVPDYGVRDMHNAVLTHDFIDQLCSEVYPIPKLEDAYHIFERWQEYIKFRKYYLGVQSGKCEEIMDVSAIHGHVVSKAAYRKNEDIWSNLLLDGHEELSRGEQVVLKREVQGADEFPFIRVAIEKNKKAVLSETTGKSGKGKPKYEVHLRRYTKESMGLSSLKPEYDAEGNLLKGFRFQQYLLGERFAFTISDIEPLK